MPRILRWSVSLARPLLYPLNHGTVLGPCVNDGLHWVFGLH